MDFRHHYQRGERREAEQVAYQWDLGHVAEIFVPLDATYNISYCFSDYDKTDDYVVESITAADDGGYKLTAHVPNKYFERSGELRVYVIGSADDHILTTYEGFITIRGRIKPDDYTDDDPENGAETIIAMARRYANESEAWAVGQIEGTDVPSTDPQYNNNSKYYATAAAGSATTASAKASQAASSASTASGKATEAATSATNASGYADNASASAIAAATSATNASSSATEASNSAAAASGSASTASTKASEAATSATNASGSATAAATSAGQAASSATAASGSATAAADSAEDAQEMSYTAEAWAVGTKNGIDVGSSDPQYHNNAKYYKEHAASSASSASTSASTATTKASQASTSASTASTAATTATNQATASKSYAVGGTGSRSGENTDNSKYYKEQAASSASSASSSSSSASTSATTATTQATLAKSYAVGGTGSRSGENTDNAKYYKEQAEAAAAQLDAEKILGNFAHYESTTTASRPYKVGEYLTYNGYLYRVTAAISSGGTITPNTNCKQTTVGDEVANNCLRFENVTVSATTGDIATITDARITADHVVAECVWGNASAITTDVTCTTSAGRLVLNGTCTTATTATVTLVKKCN